MRIVKDIEKSRSRDFCQFSEGFGIAFQQFGLGKEVSVLVLENLVFEKKYLFRFRRIWSRKKSLGFISGKFGIEKSLGIGFGQNFGIVIQWPQRILNFLVCRFSTFSN